jgi:glycosyltransferase involved in cell wall biosynthesis
VPIDISVVIPTYRRNGQLIQAIASVQAQAGATLEIMVVDDCPDGSAKSTVDAVRDRRISYLRNPNPTGGVPSRVRNFAWPSARGRFVHFLDDDDVVPAGHYAAVTAAFSQRPDVGLVFGRVEPFGDCPEAQLQHERRFFAQAALSAALCERFGRKLSFAGQMLFDLPLLVCSAGVVRRECIAGVGGFDPMIRLMEDADFYVRVMRRYGACFVDRPVLKYRIGFPSLMHAADPPPAQLQLQREGRQRMQAKYLREYGTVEFYALALFTRMLRLARPRLMTPEGRSTM